MDRPVTDPRDVDLGSILAVFAHPDDEAYLCGVLMAVAVDAGRRVICVTATRGELGFPDDDQRSLEERGALRAQEIEECLAVLGVHDHRWLGYPDGGCADVPFGAPVETLRTIINEVQPDSVLTFGPDGGTFHPDHIAISHWTTLACREASGAPQLLYSTKTPEWGAKFSSTLNIGDVMMIEGAEPPTSPADELEVWFVPDDDLAARKGRALQCQESQTAPLIDQIGIEAYSDLMRDEFFRAPLPDDWPG